MGSDADLSASKCAVVVDEALPAGLAANAASVLAMTLANQVPGIIGPDVKDGDGRLHAGIVLIPVPILTAPADRLVEIQKRLSGEPGITSVGFTSLAQSCRTYEEYVERVSQTASDDLVYIAIGVFGPRRFLNRLTGSLPLLR